MNSDKKEEDSKNLLEKENEVIKILLDQIKLLASINKNTVEHFEGTLNEPEHVAKNSLAMIELAEFILYR